MRENDKKFGGWPRPMVAVPADVDIGHAQGTRSSTQQQKTGTCLRDSPKPASADPHPRDSQKPASATKINSKSSLIPIPPY